MIKVADFRFLKQLPLKFDKIDDEKIQFFLLFREILNKTFTIDNYCNFKVNL